MIFSGEVSIVIVSYNVKELIQNCLTSVLQFSFDEIMEILVVDNASADGTVVMLKEKFPDLYVEKKT